MKNVIFKRNSMYTGRRAFTHEVDKQHAVYADRARMSKGIGWKARERERKRKSKRARTSEREGARVYGWWKERFLARDSVCRRVCRHRRRAAATTTVALRCSLLKRPNALRLTGYNFAECVALKPYACVYILVFATRARAFIRLYFRP